MAHTDRQAASDSKESPLHSVVKQQQSAGLQSPGSSVSPSGLGLSLSVPNEANRKIFAGVAISGCMLFQSDNDRSWAGYHDSTYLLVLLVLQH